MRGRRPFTADEDVIALKMTIQGLMPGRIGLELGRHRTSVHNRRRTLDAVSPADAAERLKEITEGSPSIIPALLPVEEEQRLRSNAYDLRSFTAQLCGDPPVGYSALDKLRAKEAAR